MKPDNHDNDNFAPNIRSALSRYEARHRLPDSMIADTMREISRISERRAYIRDIVIASIASIIVLVVAFAISRYFGVKLVFTIPIVDTFTGIVLFIKRLIASPFIDLLVITSVILLSLDRLLHRLYDRHSLARNRPKSPGQ